MPLQVTLKHVSHYWMFYEAALKPWVHYVPVGQYDARDILPVRSSAVPLNARPAMTSTWPDADTHETDAPVPSACLMPRKQYVAAMCVRGSCVLVQLRGAVQCSWGRKALGWPGHKSTKESTPHCRRHQPTEAAVHPILQIIDWLREHDDEAHRIALAGQAFAQRHLTRPGRLCYLRKLLHTYASLLRC
jgi:Glycosyl transferase family 90